MPSSRRNIFRAGLAAASMLAGANPLAAGSSNRRVLLTMPKLICRAKTEGSEDEIYLILAGRTSQGNGIAGRMPQDHWDLDEKKPSKAEVTDIKLWKGPSPTARRSTSPCSSWKLTKVPPSTPRTWAASLPIRRPPGDRRSGSRRTSSGCCPRHSRTRGIRPSRSSVRKGTWRSSACPPTSRGDRSRSGSASTTRTTAPGSSGYDWRWTAEGT